MWVATTLLVPVLSAQTPRPQLPADTPSTAPVLNTKERLELLGSVDATLEFVSQESGLAIHRRVRPRLVSREEVTRYLQDRFREDKGAKRLERSGLVLKKFGLLPRSFDLQPFLLRLLTEQIAGYYDTKTKVVNLLNWVSVEEQRPVLAHELTHALQDQAVGLERWSDVGQHGVARTQTAQNRSLGSDEAETARSAVAEGQAMLVYTAYALRPTKHTLLDSPEILEHLLSPDAAAATDTSPVLAEAPRVLQEALLFPYTDGLAFEAALLREGGRQRAFAEALQRPPASSFEVMTPAAYLRHEVAPVLLLPDLNKLLGRGWTPYDVGVIGEVDARMLVEQYGTVDDVKALTPRWAGGSYYAAQRSDSSGSDRRSTASLGLVYLSRWKDAEAAERFAAVYRAGLRGRYGAVHAIAQGESGEEAGSSWWSTDEGEVCMTRRGPSVLTVEGFSHADAMRIRAAMLPAGSAGSPVKTGTSPQTITGRPHTLLSTLARPWAAAHYTLSRPGKAEERERVRVNQR